MTSFRKINFKSLEEFETFLILWHSKIESSIKPNRILILVIDQAWFIVQK